MAGNQAVVEFLLKWSESGGQLPEKVKRDLDRMGQSGQQASSITDKLGLAFTRLERREPTNAVRQLRSTIDGLAASAIGATGPLGRLAVNFTSLGTGGVVGTVAIGGLAAIGLEVKTLIGLSGDLEKAMLKANDAIAALGGQAATHWTDVRKLREEIEDLSKPGLIENLLSRGGFGIEDIATSIAGSRYSRLATAQTALGITLGNKPDDPRAAAARKEQESIDRAYNTALRSANQALAESVVHGQRLRGVITDDAMRLALERIKLEAQGFNDAMIRSIQTIEAVTRAQQERDRTARVAQGLAGFGPAAALGLSRPTLGLRGGIPRPLAATGLGPMPTGLEGLSDDALARVLEASGHGAGGGGNTAAILSAILGFAGSVRGGPSGALSGLAGITGAIKDSVSKASSAARVLPVIGTGLSVLSGLTSLFGGHGGAKVTISDFEQAAIDKMAQVQRIPQNVSYNIAAAGTRDRRDIAYDLDRTSRLGLVKRGG